MDINKDEISTWKTGTQQIPKPVEMQDINEDELIIKKKDKQ